MRQTLLYMLYVSILAIGDMCIAIIAFFKFIGIILSLPIVFIQILMNHKG